MSESCLSAEEVLRMEKQLRKEIETLEIKLRETERARDEWRNQGKANSEAIRDIRYVLSQIEEPK